MTRIAFFVSIGFSLIAWGIMAARYIWPALRHRSYADALRPLLVLHSFRFVGLAFLVSGVVSPDLPHAFANSAAFGDLVAASLAFLSLMTLRAGVVGVVIAWIFNLWGSADLLNAFYQANSTGLSPGQLGATYFIPTLVVPLLMITHALAFRILLQHRSESSESAVRGSRRLPACGNERRGASRTQAASGSEALRRSCLRALRLLAIEPRSTPARGTSLSRSTFSTRPRSPSARHSSCLMTLQSLRLKKRMRPFAPSQGCPI